jgi:hypothetical protein
MGDAYLEGLKKTWVESNEVARKLGQVKVALWQPRATGHPAR